MNGNAINIIRSAINRFTRVFRREPVRKKLTRAELDALLEGCDVKPDVVLLPPDIFEN